MVWYQRHLFRIVNLTIRYQEEMDNPIMVQLHIWRYLLIKTGVNTLNCEHLWECTDLTSWALGLCIYALMTEALLSERQDHTFQMHMIDLAGQDPFGPVDHMLVDMLHHPAHPRPVTSSY